MASAMLLDPGVLNKYIATNVPEPACGYLERKGLIIRGKWQMTAWVVEGEGELYPSGAA